jgi:hypothetical protein
MEKEMADNMTVAVASARRLLKKWESEGHPENESEMSDGHALMIALVVASRQLQRYEAGLEWRHPCA